MNILYTNDGLIKGTVLTSRGGKKFRAFYGIPYALPPVGELRYKVSLLSCAREYDRIRILKR